MDDGSDGEGDGSGGGLVVATMVALTGNAQGLGSCADVLSAPSKSELLQLAL